MIKGRESGITIKSKYREVSEKIIKELRDIMGIKGGGLYIYVLGILVNVVMMNVISQIPYTYAGTSQIILGLSYSMSIMIGVTIKGIRRKKSS
jgi:F0F1-type ATP synthase membrane subunit a